MCSRVYGLEDRADVVQNSRRLGTAEPLVLIVSEPAAVSCVHEPNSTQLERTYEY